MLATTWLARPHFHARATAAPPAQKLIDESVTFITQHTWS
jgi:hypothetical protein